MVVDEKFIKQWINDNVVAVIHCNCEPLDIPELEEYLYLAFIEGYRIDEMNKK